MRIGELCTCAAVYCHRDATALEAAQLMRNQHVGDLIVVDEPNGERVPVGILTDRDLAIEVMAKELDAASVKVGEIITGNLLTVNEEEPVYETIQRMRFQGVRRVPVVNKHGGLVGIITVDDLAEYLAEEMTELARISGRQQFQEHQRRP